MDNNLSKNQSLGVIKNDSNVNGLLATLSPSTTQSRTTDTAITASAPCVCLRCVCSFVITKEGKQTTQSNWTKVGKSKDTEDDTANCKRIGDKIFTGKIIFPVINPLLLNTKGIQIPKQILKG